MPRRTARTALALLAIVCCLAACQPTTTLAQAATEIDKLLRRPAGTATPDGLGYVLACYRETPVMKDDLVNGEKWSDVGGLYRILLEQTS